MACLQACLSHLKAYHGKWFAPQQISHDGETKTYEHATWGQTQQ